MINDILMPALEKRSWEVVGICEENNNEVFLKFSSMLKEMKKNVPINMVDNLNEIEDLFIQSNTETAISAHRLGFEDCQRLYGQIRCTLK